MHLMHFLTFMKDTFLRNISLIPLLDSRSFFFFKKKVLPVMIFFPKTLISLGIPVIDLDHKQHDQFSLNLCHILGGMFLESKKT